MEDKASRLRTMLGGTSTILIAGAHDGLSAKLGERHGFDAIWASGLGISAVQTVPDASILTMAELLSAAVIMNESSSLPVVADCDSGFGNVHNVVRMVQKYEGAGIAGVCIEDKVYPKLNSFMDAPQTLVPIRDFCAKIRAAKHAQHHRDFVVIARVEALIAGLGQAEAQRRASAYANAGADAVLIHSRRRDPSEIHTFVREWGGRVPLVVVPTQYPSMSAMEFHEIGVRAVIYANQALRASLRAVDRVFRDIRVSGSSLGIEDDVASVEEVFELQGVAAMDATEHLAFTMFEHRAS